jgi:hypothetical protein
VTEADLELLLFILEKENKWVPRFDAAELIWPAVSGQESVCVTIWFRPDEFLFFLFPVRPSVDRVKNKSSDVFLFSLKKIRKKNFVCVLFGRIS